MYRLARINLLLALFLLITGCASQGSVDKPQGEQENQPVETRKAPPSPPARAGCEWEKIRGIAELVRIDNGMGQFLFYPGAVEVERQISPDWHEGQEFKSVLQLPISGNCSRPRLEAIEAVVNP